MKRPFATDRPTGRGIVAGKALTSEEVLGSRWEQEACDVVDAVWLKDARIAEIVTDGD